MTLKYVNCFSIFQSVSGSLPHMRLWFSISCIKCNNTRRALWVLCLAPRKCSLLLQFALEEAAEAACREHYHEIKGKMVEAKKAQPKEAMTNLQLKKWSYGTTSITGAPADAGLPFYLSSSSQRNPMFAAAAVNNPGNPYNGGQFHPNFAYSPVMNYPGSPTFQVSPNVFFSRRILEENEPDYYSG